LQRERELNSTPVLKISKIVKSYAEKQVLAGISFEVNPGEIVALLGPSGCGKSTLLSIIAGIETPDEGKISWMGKPIDHVPPHLRGFGLMFQDNVLFPHLNVFENIAFGLKMSGMEVDSIQGKVADTLELVGLEGLEHRDVNSLSGGEQQRVALARSLAPQPGLLMLDEPLGSLDRSLRERLMGELRQILRQMEQTAIYVTHDQEEAFAIADQIVLMRDGMVEQIGSPEKIYREPATLFAATFLGLTNLIPGTAIFENGCYSVETALGKFPISKELEGQVTVLIRPDSASLKSYNGILINGKLVEKNFRGNLCQAKVSFNDTLLTFNFLSNSDFPSEGESIQLSLDPQEAVTAFNNPSNPDT
jgi:ABC-type Fe3+/spermidine/putrescine transport system ATPase subunit